MQNASFVGKRLHHTPVLPFGLIETPAQGVGEAPVIGASGGAKQADLNKAPHKHGARCCKAALRRFAPIAGTAKARAMCGNGGRRAQRAGGAARTARGATDFTEVGKGQNATKGG